jgi:cobalt/nickel transport system permease protein
MHMADALISPAVGGVMLAASVTVGAASVRKIGLEADDKKIPLMGVMGAFVFAAQMINFTIPGTGSSGHIGGGILLASLLGPSAGFLTMAAILLIQALFFADGGLLAYGCNLFNMGFLACFLGYALCFKPLLKRIGGARGVWAASLVSCVAGLQFGAFGVVLETLFSGKTELPFGAFAALMQPIHMAIGLGEGLVTAAALSFVWQARPELFDGIEVESVKKPMSMKGVLTVFTALAVAVGGVLSWFASSNPDGLEWAVGNIVSEELAAEGAVYEASASVQEKTALLPDYGFRASEEADGAEEAAWPAISAGTSVSGLAGGALTLALAALAGFLIRLLRRRKTQTA